MADLMEAYNHQFAPTAEVLCKRCMVRHRFHAVDELGRPWLFFDVEGELLLEGYRPVPRAGRSYRAQA